MSGRTKSRWSDKAVLKADVHTMDTEECVAMLRSRGVNVPDGRVERTQLESLVRSLQQSIIDGTSTKPPAPEGRKRVNSSRSKATTKTAAEKEIITEDDATKSTPARPRRKSGAATTKKAATAAAVPKEEQHAEEQEEQQEPEKKKKRTSTKRATKVKSTVRQVEQEEEQNKDEPEPVEKVKKASKSSKKSGTVVRGKKRAAEKLVEEVAIDEEEEKQKPAKKSGKSLFRKPKRKKEEEEQAVVAPELTAATSIPQELMEVEEHHAVQPFSPQPPSFVNLPKVGTTSVRENLLSGMSLPNYNVVSEPPEAAMRLQFGHGSSEEKQIPVLVDSKDKEDVIVVGSTVPVNPDVEEIVVDDNVPEKEEKKKGLFVSSKIIVMIIGIALFAVFLGLFFCVTMKQNISYDPVMNTENTTVIEENVSDTMNDAVKEAVMGNPECEGLTLNECANKYVKYGFDVDHELFD